MNEYISHIQRHHKEELEGKICPIPKHIAAE
jgi:hypothetical protein